MADNISTTPGSGASIAADDVGGVLHQRVKISVGADGAAVDMRPPADSLPGTATLPAGALIWDDALGAFRMARTARIDGETQLSIPAGSPYLYNGATFDRQRGNMEGTLLASAARTVYTVSATQTNYNARGVVLILTITSVGSGTLAIQLLGVDNGQGYEIAASAQATATHVLMAYPGVIDADVSHSGRSVTLPRSWAAAASPSGGTSWTYSLSYSLII